MKSEQVTKQRQLSISEQSKRPPRKKIQSLFLTHQQTVLEVILINTKYGFSKIMCYNYVGGMGEVEGEE